MNVNTILISPEEAYIKLDEYKSLTERQRTDEDRLLLSLYNRIKAGGRVLNLASAFKQTGLNELGQPRMAIARADWYTVNFVPRLDFSSSWRVSGAGGFTDKARWNKNATQQNIALPARTFDDSLLTSNRLHSPVPHIPPSIRPEFALSNYHILFEVKEWEVYPVDPFLLRRISGMLFVVEAEWELTELEAMLLSSMQPTGN